MGRRITQRIVVCDDCNKAPIDGEYLWEMCGENVCEPCIDIRESAPEDEDNDT